MRRAPAAPGGVEGRLLTIALAWAEPGGARGGGCRGSVVRGSGYRKPRGERLDRKEPPAPSWSGRWGGSRGRAAPLAEPLAARWLLGRRLLGPAAGPAGGAAFRPLLLGLALRAETLGFPRSGADPPTPRGDAPQPPRARRLGLEGGTGRFTPHLRPCAPPFRLDLCAVWHFTWLLISTFTLVFWVEKWPKFTQRSLMSVFNHPCSFCDGRTMGRFQCRGGSDFVFSLEKYYFIYLPRIDIQWRFFTSGLGRLLGNRG